MGEELKEEGGDEYCRGGERNRCDRRVCEDGRGSGCGMREGRGRMRRKRLISSERSGEEYEGKRKVRVCLRERVGERIAIVHRAFGHQTDYFSILRIVSDIWFL